MNGKVEQTIRRLIANNPEISAALAGGLAGGVGETANIYFSLNPSDVGRREYERRIKRNFVRGVTTGAAAGLVGAHVYGKVRSPAFTATSYSAPSQKSAMITIKLASVAPADAKPGNLVQSALEKLKGSPLLQSVLASGALGAGAGGILSALAPQQEGEDRSARRKRIIRNMLLTGAMAGGGVGAIGLAHKNLTTALPANDRGSPVAQTGIAALRTAPAAAVAGLRGHSRFKDERAGAESLMQKLRANERAAGPFTGSWSGKGEPAPEGKGKGGKTSPSKGPSAHPLSDYFSSQTGVSQSESGQRISNTKGAPSSPGESLRRLFRGRDMEIDGEPTLTRHMRNIGGSALNPESLRDAGINPAYAKANPSTFSKAKGMAGLWKDRVFKPGGGRMGPVGGLAAAGLGLFTPEIASGLYTGGEKAINFLDGADDNIPQL